MQFDLSNITDAQQKEYSFLSNKKKQHLLFIEKEKKVDSEKTDSYLSRRAHSALENAKNRLQSSKEYYDKVVREAKEYYDKALREAKTDWELTSKKYEDVIQLQEGIIDAENNKKNPNVTRALLDVEEIDRKILALGLPSRNNPPKETSPPPPHKIQEKEKVVCKVVEQPSEEEEYEQAKQSFLSDEKEPECKSLWVQETFQKQYITKPKQEEISDDAFERWAAANAYTKKEEPSFKQDMPSFPPTISNTKKKPVKMTYSQMQRLKELQSH
jgi:hypothetical protein